MARYHSEHMANAWTDLLRKKQYQAAGRKVIQLVQSKGEGEGVSPTEIMQIGQELGLDAKGMTDVFNLLKESNAIKKAQAQARVDSETNASNVLNAQNEVDLMGQTGLPRDVAGRMLTTKQEIPTEESKPEWGSVQVAGENDPNAPQGSRYQVKNDGAVKIISKPNKLPASTQALTLDFDKGVALVDQLERMFLGDENTPGLAQYEGVLGKLMSNKENLSAWIGANPDVKAYNDFADGTIAPLVRSLGEKGNLSDTDIERAIKLIPRYPTTNKEAKAKFAALKDLLSKTKENIAKVTGGNTEDDVKTQLYAKYGLEL